MLPPNSADGGLADALGSGHGPGLPVRRVRRLAVQGGFSNGRSLVVTDRRNPARTGSSLLQTGGAERPKRAPAKVARRAARRAACPQCPGSPPPRQPEVREKQAGEGCLRNR